MTEFTTRTTSPFRYDIVGSFLRPQELKEARTKFANGEITQADLTAVEDKAIINLIKQEEAAGLKAVTDGEFRRSWWHLDFFWGLNGVKKATLKEGYKFADEETRPETPAKTTPLSNTSNLPKLIPLMAFKLNKLSLRQHNF